MMDDYLVDLLVLVNAEAIASEHRVHISPGTIDGFLKKREKYLKCRKILSFSLPFLLRSREVIDRIFPFFPTTDFLDGLLEIEKWRIEDYFAVLEAGIFEFTAAFGMSY